MSKQLLKILVFVSGLSVMAVEMTGLRLLAPFFGTSLIVTTVLIGSMMGFLSLGYWLGGRYADRYPTLKALSRISGAASVLVILIPFLGMPILRAASATLRPLLMGRTLDEPTVAFATLIGGLIATLGLFAMPVTLMGMVSPWAVRLAVDEVESSGKAAGQLYALSTFGSILGSFLPAIVLLPLLGVRNTFIFVGVLLLGASAAGFLTKSAAAIPPAIAAALMLLPTGSVRPMDGLVWEGESLYHFIQVVQEPYGKCEDAYHLYLNEGVGIHSVKCPDPDDQIRGVWSYMASAPFYADDLTDFKDVLIIGLAGGTIGRQMLEVFPNVEIDGVEIDGKVVEVGEEFFDNADERITPIVMDGRIYLQFTDKKYDLIMMDAYRQPYIPFHLVTDEFFEQVDAHLTEDGIVAINVASVRGVSRSLAGMIYKTLRETFPTVILIDATTSNDILIATRQEKDKFLAADQIEKTLDKRTEMALGRVRSRLRKKIIGEVEGWESSRVLTDDQAPVEQAWDLMAIEYAR
ncbi:MAG: fused MFS/spermidine synthase [Myxococcota bacterium]